jgi:HAD superfamily hydrolase (TIGR01458 family)
MSNQAVLFDIGGVLLDGERPLPRAIESLTRLRRAAIPFLLLTNTTRRSHAALWQALTAVGIQVAAEHLLTPASLASAWLRDHAHNPYFLIHPGLQADFSAFAAPTAAQPPDVVVIGDAGDGFTYDHLNTAFRAVMAGAPLVSLSDSRYFQEPAGLSLDAGPFVHLLECAARIQAISLGKPGALFFGEALARLGVPAGQVTMIGDDVVSDIQGASAMGMQAVLVETGKYRPGDAALLPPGAQQAADVGAAVDRLLAAN